MSESGPRRRLNKRADRFASGLAGKGAPTLAQVEDTVFDLRLISVTADSTSIQLQTMRTSNANDHRNF